MSTGFKDLHWFSSCMAVICKEPCVIEEGFWNGIDFS